MIYGKNFTTNLDEEQIWRRHVAATSNQKQSKSIHKCSTDPKPSPSIKRCCPKRTKERKNQNMKVRTQGRARRVWKRQIQIRNTRRMRRGVLKRQRAWGRVLAWGLEREILTWKEKRWEILGVFGVLDSWDFRREGGAKPKKEREARERPRASRHGNLIKEGGAKSGGM